MAEGRDPSSLWKLALKKKEGPKWMDLVKTALTEANPDAKRETLGMVSKVFLLKQLLAEEKADEFCEMRASLNAADNSASGQPLDLEAIEEYSEKRDAEEDQELVEECEKTAKEVRGDESK